MKKQWKRLNKRETLNNLAIIIGSLSTILSGITGIIHVFYHKEDSKFVENSEKLTEKLCYISVIISNFRKLLT